MPPTNRAAWLKTKQGPEHVVDSAPYTAPSDNELVIKTGAMAINPADVIIQKMGIIIPEDKYPAILGCDAAGEVVEVHPSLASKFTVGDRVMGCTSTVQFRNEQVEFIGLQYAGFQEFAVLKLPFLTKIPKHMRLEDAAVLPLAVLTSSSCLFAKETLALTPPMGKGKEGNQGKTLLVWGASSSVGSCGVQLATQAGYDVVGIASKKNHEMVKALGVREVFDQSDPNLAENVLQSLKGKDVVGAYDAITADASFDGLCQILERCEGRKLICSVMPGAEEKATRGVKIVTNFVADAEEFREGMGNSIWRWLEKALEEGKLKSAPPADVVGSGLESVQKALDLMEQGVSAKKLVIAI